MPSEKYLILCTAGLLYETGSDLNSARLTPNVSHLFTLTHVMDEKAEMKRESCISLQRRLYQHILAHINCMSIWVFMAFPPTVYYHLNE